ncbi:SDR family oxidoreductase [Silvibacterium sp.]|uniref:SDR family oxidoreductase n=1 Tax=Silvibacterium sp. TaxID=1964179 RepID=UPI0039E54C6C
MKIILTGATGFVGACTLQHLVADRRVSKIICLTRKLFPADSPKVNPILHEDFAVYDDALLDELANSQACIWTLGAKESDLADRDALASVTYTFTLAMARGIAERVKHPFTFCYLSGMGADQAESARLPWERATRHLKGRTEKDLLALQEDNANFSVHCFRPGGILPDDANRVLRFLLAPIVVSVGELADAMIAESLEEKTFRRHPIIHNSAMKELYRTKDLGVPFHGGS